MFFFCFRKVPICDSATSVLSLSHNGEQGKPNSFSFSPCLKYSSMRNSVHVWWIVHGLPGWLISALWRTNANAFDFSMLKEKWNQSKCFSFVYSKTNFSGMLSKLFIVFNCVKWQLISVARTISITKCRKFLWKRENHFEKKNNSKMNFRHTYIHRKKILIWYYNHQYASNEMLR